MAEYIEREALENAFEDENKNGNFVFTANWIMEILDNLPPADVVQKSEVERLQAEVDQLHALLECGVFANSVEDWQKFLNEKRAEVALEIFAEIEEALILSKCYGDSGVYFERDIETDIAELKKKYTEA